MIYKFLGFSRLLFGLGLSEFAGLSRLCSNAFIL
jgi:hypothetical protein